MFGGSGGVPPRWRRCSQRRSRLRPIRRPPILSRGGDLRVAVPQVPATPDPVVTTLGENWRVAANVCEGLFGLDENWQPAAHAGRTRSNTTTRRNTLTVKLRQGITFHSGAPLTSDDVVASLKRYAGSAGTGAVLKSLVNDISGDGPDTVVFKLTGPTGVVPGLLTLTPAVDHVESLARRAHRRRSRSSSSIAPDPTS